MEKIEINIDCSDISEIFKNNLKIENKLKTISSIFGNKRFASRINYKPYFQRNYVWDVDKATYFIESILLGTEIPPLVLFDNQFENQVIDGRQRYETIEKFINNNLCLSEEGLKVLKSLSGTYFVDLDSDIKDQFEETKLRILQCSVVNEPYLSEEREDKVKKEVFKRYNSGITPLHKEEIERAEFIADSFTQRLSSEMMENNKLLEKSKALFLSKRQKKKKERDIINILMAKIRTLLVLPHVPINNYANSSSKADVISKYYYYLRDKINIDCAIEEYEEIINILIDIKGKIGTYNLFLSESVLFYECCYWCLAIIKNTHSSITDFDVDKFVTELCENGEASYLWNDIVTETKQVCELYEQTGSHYYKSILNRYKFMSNYFRNEYHYVYNKNFSDLTNFKKVMSFENDYKVEFEKYMIHKADPTSMTIEDIMEKIKKEKFLIRPKYQRSEVSNIVKSSYLMESIMLDMKVPPIYIYKREDKVFEVIDGQQRLLSIIGYLGKQYLDENGKDELSQKHLFKLKDLKILSDLNGKSINELPNKYVNKILDFQLDVVEIDAGKNGNFDNIDLFLRLNTKPYPIRQNSFEMWNVYVNKETVVEIKKLAELNEGKIFKKKDTRMSIEELITSLAYLDYMNKKQISAYDILTIYKKDNRINARIKKKAAITKLLSDINTYSSKTFIESVISVSEFIDKVWCLLDNQQSKISDLFSTSSYNSGKTDQNFYLLWLMMQEFNKFEIISNKESIFLAVRNIFSQAQDIVDNDAEDFIKKLKNINRKLVIKEI